MFPRWTSKGTALKISLVFLMVSTEEPKCQAQERSVVTSAEQLDSTENAKEPRASQTVTFGHRQIEQMLEDRPDMNNAALKSHPMYEAIVEGYNGKLIGQRVYWVDTNTDTAAHSLKWTPFFGPPA